MKEITFKQLEQFIERNKNNNKQLFLHYHNNYVPPHHRKNYERFITECKVPELRKSDFGIYNEIYAYWYYMDIKEGIEV